MIPGPLPQSIDGVGLLLGVAFMFKPEAIDSKPYSSIGSLERSRALAMGLRGRINHVTASSA